MTGLQIKTMAEMHTEGDTIDSSLALRFINECMRMVLGREAGLVATVTIAATKDTWASLPALLLEIVEIEKTGQTVPYYGTRYETTYKQPFDVRNGQIRFPETGTYTVSYVKYPAEITDIVQTPEVNELFHYPMALYIASRYKSNDDEENADASRLMGEFVVYKNSAIAEVNRGMKFTTKPGRFARTSRWT